MSKIINIIFILALIVLAGCTPSDEEIAETVTSSMQETFNTDSNFQAYDLKVKSIQVFKKDDNNYKGLVDIVYKNTSHSITIDILINDDNIMWEAPSGSFMFIAQDALKNL